MSNWPTPFFVKCPICDDYINIEVTERGLAAYCPAPARKFKGEHRCKKLGWEVVIVGRKSEKTISKESVWIPEFILFPEPKIFPRRKMKLKLEDKNDSNR